MNKGLPQMMQQKPPRKGHFWASMFVLFSLAFVGWLAINGLFNPYSFLLGGRFHLLPGWQGSGWLHSDKAGGDYYLFVNMTPTSSRGKIVPSSSLKGMGYLCTPLGERIKLKVGATMAFNPPSDTVGQPINLYLYGYKAFRDLTAPTDYRPRLQLHGVWGNQELVVEDHGDLEREFLPDGTMAPLKPPRSTGGTITATLKQAPWWQFMPNCPAK